jgi:hypothetical protein
MDAWYLPVASKRDGADSTRETEETKGNLKVVGKSNASKALFGEQTVPKEQETVQ